MRIEERELLAAVNPVLGVVDIEQDRRGTCSKLSQNNSIIAAIMRLSAVALGRYSSRLIVGCERGFHRFPAIIRGDLEGGVGFQRVTSLPSDSPPQSARHDRGHLGQFVPHPVRVARTSRHAAKRSAILSRCSIAATSNIPPSEVSRPPSNPTCTGLPATAGKPGKIPVPSSMAGANSVLRFDPALATKSYTKPTVYAAPAVPSGQSNEFFRLTGN